MKWFNRGLVVVLPPPRIYDPENQWESPIPRRNFSPNHWLEQFHLVDSFGRADCHLLAARPFWDAANLLVESWMFQKLRLKNIRQLWRSGCFKTIAIFDFLGHEKELSPPYLPSTGLASLGHRVAMPMCWCAPLLAHPTGRGISLAFFCFFF